MKFIFSILNQALHDKFFIVAIIFLFPIITMALFPDFIAPYNPLKTGVGPSMTQPSEKYLMGTDQAGSDIFSQVVYGAVTAIYVAFFSTLIAVFVALIIGVTAGYFGGLIDEILMRITDMILSIPSFVLIIFLVVLFGSNINILMLIIALVSWPTMARIARAQTLSVREREFVLAAKALGAGSNVIMSSEILPNIILPLLPTVTLQIGFAILIESGISFLGLGDQNVMSWGRVLYLASRAIYAGGWWSILFPGLAIIITIIGFNLMGDSLGRVINPRASKH